MEEQEEDYWTTSSVKNSRKNNNIFDDGVTVEAASDLARFKKSIQEDDIETVDWDDTPVSKPISGTQDISGTSMPTRPTFDAHYRSPLQKSNPSASSSSSTTSHQGHSRSRSEHLVGGMGKMSLTKSPSVPKDTLLSSLDNEPSISSMLGVSDTKPTVGGRKMLSPQEQEIQYLQRQLQEAQRGLTGSKMTVEDTIKRMLLGQPFSLEQYKSMEDKLKLLDKALQTHDGNCIIAAVIFLKRTLDYQIFHMEMMRRPQALDQYLAYLRAHFNYTELEHMLGLLGRSEELAMLKFKQTLSVEDPKAKIDKLTTCLRAHFEGSPVLQHDSSLLRQQIDLLHRQRPVDEADTAAQIENKHVVFRALPKKASIIHMPVITTLYYCCLYHYEEPENLLGSPQAIRKEHQLTEKQFVWTAVKARAKLKKWGDVEDLFKTKSWLGGTKMKAVISFDKVASVLHKSGAPTDIIGKYLNLMDDVDQRMELAVKMQCHDVVIDIYKAQRDRRALEQYQMKLKAHSREWFYAKDVLSSNQTKWKT